MSGKSNRALVLVAALALGGILYATWRTLEPLHAERVLAAPAASQTSELGPELELTDSSHGRAQERGRQGPDALEPTFASERRQPDADVAEPLQARRPTLRGFMHDRAGAPIEAARVATIAREAGSALRAKCGSTHAPPSLRCH